MKRITVILMLFMALSPVSKADEISKKSLKQTLEFLKESFKNAGSGTDYSYSFKYGTDMDRIFITRNVSTPSNYSEVYKILLNDLSHVIVSESELGFIAKEHEDKFSLYSTKTKSNDNCSNIILRLSSSTKAKELKAVFDHLLEERIYWHFFNYYFDYSYINRKSRTEKVWYSLKPRHSLKNIMNEIAMVEYSVIDSPSIETVTEAIAALKKKLEYINRKFNPLLGKHKTMEKWSAASDYYKENYSIEHRDGTSLFDVSFKLSKFRNEKFTIRLSGYKNGRCIWVRDRVVSGVGEYFFDMEKEEKIHVNWNGYKIKVVPHFKMSSDEIIDLNYYRFWKSQVEGALKQGEKTIALLEEAKDFKIDNQGIMDALTDAANGLERARKAKLEKLANQAKQAINSRYKDGSRAHKYAMAELDKIIDGKLSTEQKSSKVTVLINKYQR